MKRVSVDINCGADCFTDHIVKKMWELSNRDSKDPVIIKRAKSLKGNSKTATIRNIYNYVVKKVPYVSDPKGIELITAPIYLENGKKVGGDCDCMVTLMTSLLTAVGIKSRIVTLSWRIPQFTHVYLEAHNGISWKILDPTKGKAGYGKTIPKSQDKVKRRVKKYENPMELVSLEDCGCAGNSPLNDCGCGCGGRGKCGGRKNRAKNYNSNVINIGNDIARHLNLTANNSHNTNNRPFIKGGKSAPVIDRITGEEKKVILNQKGSGLKRYTRYVTVPNRPFY